MNSETKWMAAFGLLMSIPFIVVGVALWRGYVLSVVWGWVMVTHFGAPLLSIPLAIAVSSLVSMLTHSRAGNQVTDEEKKWVPAMAAFLGPLFCMFTVWIALKFV